MRTPVRITATVLLAATVSIVAIAQVAAADFTGKTITVIVGSAVGGSVDTQARNIVEYWKRHIPGKPQLIVQNMEGASGLRATNFLYEKAKPDGLTVFFGPWTPVAQLLGLPEMRARYQDFGFVGGFGDTRVAIMRTDTAPGVKVPSDIAKAGKFYVGGSSASSSVDLLARMSLDMLGLQYQVVGGYGGGSNIFLAMLRNEVQFTVTSYGTLLTRSGAFIKNKEGLGVYYYCVQGTDGNLAYKAHVQDIPCFADLYKDIKGTAPSGPVWDALNMVADMSSTLVTVALVAPKTPQDVVETLRDAFYQAAKEPDLIKKYIEQTGAPPEVATAADAQATINAIFNAKPEDVATLKRYVESGG